MKKSKRVTLVLLTAALILIAGISAFAVADEPSTEKEEVVYANTDANGDVRGVYVVNIFAGGDIVDYGDYAEVKVLNTTDEISQNGDKITVSTDAESLYYEGTMESRDLPWDIDIRYTLNGERITPEELAGKSGELEISLGFHQNIACDSSFFDRYALQTTMTLDTEKCENIVANGATVANVGQNKQLSYILLPGNEKEYTVTADVTDFEMESININGIRMDLS
ncbi:MAG: YhgE/Pip domain-containing protein, partial [Clostridia bacterium]